MRVDLEKLAGDESWWQRRLGPVGDAHLPLQCYRGVGQAFTCFYQFGSVETLPLDTFSRLEILDMVQPRPILRPPRHGGGRTCGHWLLQRRLTAPIRARTGAGAGGRARLEARRLKAFQLGGRKVCERKA